MKKQINIPIRKQLTFVLVIMSFVAGSYSQKSSTAMKEDSNIRYLKNLAAVISNMENFHAGTYIKPIELEDIRIYDNNLRFEELIFAPAYSADEEEKMQVEDWMLDEEHFRIPVSNDEALYEVAEEEKLAIEEWMLDESHFLSNNNLIEDENSVEDELKVENWMLDPDHWVSRAD